LGRCEEVVKKQRKGRLRFQGVCPLGNEQRRGFRKTNLGGVFIYRKRGLSWTCRRREISKGEIVKRGRMPFFEGVGRRKEKLTKGKGRQHELTEGLLTQVIGSRDSIIQ